MPLLSTQDATQCPKNDPWTTFGDILVALDPFRVAFGLPSGLSGTTFDPNGFLWGPLLWPMGGGEEDPCGSGDG